MPNPRGWRYWLETRSRMPQGTFLWTGVLMLPNPIQFHGNPLDVCKRRASRGYDDTGMPGAGGEVVVERVTPLPPFPPARLSMAVQPVWHYLVRGFGDTAESWERCVTFATSTTPWVGSEEDVTWASILIGERLADAHPGRAYTRFGVNDVVPLPPWPPHK